MSRVLMAMVTGVGLASAGVLAGPLDKGRVDAGAKWLVHADMEALRGSATGKFLMQHRADLDLGALDEFKAKTGLDAFRDIKDVTVYGVTNSPDDAVAMVHGNEKLEAVVEAMMKEQGEAVERLQVAGKPALKWKEGGEDRFGYLKTMGEGGRALLVSSSVGNLERAITVLDGVGTSLASVKEGPMTASPRDGSLVFVVVSELGEAAEHAPKVLRSARQVRADMGEDANGFFGEMKLTASSEDDVRNIADFGRGMLALGRMAVSSDPELKELGRVMDGVSLEAKGVELTATIRIGADLLQAALVEMKSQSKKDGSPAVERTSTPAPEQKR